MKPRGVLPRHVQMWLMVGIALVILAIILLTGHPQPLPRPQAGARPAQPTLVPPDRVRSYEQQLAADLVREQQGARAIVGASRARDAGPLARVATSSADPTAEDQRRRDYQSLFADNVALSRRAGRSTAVRRTPAGQRVHRRRRRQPARQDVALLEQLLAKSVVSPSPALTTSAPAPTLPVAPPAEPSSSEHRARRR